MSDISCPNCDGPIEVPHDSSTVVCPYCSTTVQVRTGEILKESYVMRLQYSLDDSWAKMLSWASKQLGAPKDLEQKAKIVESKLVYYPFWVVEVEAKADYMGTQSKPDFEGKGRFSGVKWKDVSEDGRIDLEKDVFVPANTRMPESLLNYQVPVKRKEFFDKDLVAETAGSLLPTQLERDAAIESAKRGMNSLLREEALKEVDSIRSLNSELSIPAVFLVHVPVWHIKYDFSIRKYDAIVDGASGRVISLKFPRKLAFRAMTMFGGLVHLGAGGGAGLLLVYLGLTRFDGIFPTVAGIAFGLGMLAFAFRFISTALTLEAEEEGAG
ncbi:MAG: hypothetical protein JSW05_12030 [Candidatus Thorarchaeota archaeon]|nr:MAG: hypothetical protein JSW05_12030 [Candidatus Thorarchaeota archaeon]